ncbi:PcfJ domain-containing protein [Leucothrix pacifica]|nr:PcfJ domain-containing protein [Leucothrix pacifica]
MNAAAAKQTIKQHFQSLNDEQLQQYHINHDYFTGRPLSQPMMPRDREVSAEIVKKQRNLKRMNEVLYPAPTLGSVLGDALAGLQLSDEPNNNVQSAILEKPSEDLVKRAKRWFNQYIQEGLASLLTTQSGRLTDANLAVIKRAFSHNTVLIQNVCSLSAFWIRSPLEWDGQAESTQGLFEHLFVQYEAPAFLKPCWSRVMDEQTVPWLLCYLMYVQGGSLKALVDVFGWTPASHKLWHQLFDCPAKLSPEHAVLYAEFKRLGGWDEDLACLMANEAYVIDLLAPVSEDSRDFWYDTCRWTISKQYEMSGEVNRKILWWARHQFTELARQGEQYRLQGRSLAKVLESLTQYEDEQASIARARARLAERGRQVSMARNEERDRLREQERLDRLEFMARRNAPYHYSDYELINLSWNERGWNWDLQAHGKQWRFVELTTGNELHEEGQIMEHCVGGYSQSCYEGHSVIFSLRCDNKRTLTIEIDPLTRDLVQVQGHYNADPKKSEYNVVKRWVNEVVHGRVYW